MKTPLFSLAISTALTSTAQWSTDPANPMLVCSAANTQAHMRAIADADSGYYVFWSDQRNDPAKADLYGQHFDSEGNAMWTANGELLLSNPTKSINQVAPLLMPDGSVIVAFATAANTFNGDTVRAMRFDADANALWTDPAILLGGLDYRTLQMVLSDSCAYLVSYCESCGGGGYGCRMQRVRMDGTVQFDLPGQTTGSSYYGPYTIHPDGAGGLLFNIRAGNGAGTPLKAQRFDSLGAPVWPSYLDLADADGLNYGFSTAMDINGAQTAIWEVNGDLRMRRIDTLGNSLWSPGVLPTCDLPVLVQQNPSSVAHDDELFVAWSDNRPPASNLDLYIQKFDLITGAELWAPDGVPAIQINSYIPSTGLVLSDSGSVVATFDGNIDGYSAMRVRNDGTQAWPAPVVMCTPAFNPFYERRIHLSDGTGGVVAFWESFAGDLYGARVWRNGMLYNDVGITDLSRNAAVSAFPNPADDRVTFQLPAGEVPLSIDVIYVLGAPTHWGVQAGSISLEALAPGSYVASIRTHVGTHRARFIKR